MKKVLANITKYLFGAFGLAILGLLMSLTYQALGRIFPGSFENQIWGLILFDIAAICWMLAFIFGSETVEQYAIAALGFLTGFLGTLLMVGAEVLLGQTLTPVQSQQVGQWMVYGFIGATALHAILVYAHHVAGKEMRQQIDIGIERGEVTSEAIKQAKHTLDMKKPILAKGIADDIVSQVERDLGLYPVTGTPFEIKQLAVPSPIPDEVKVMYAPGTQFNDGTMNPPAREPGAPDNYGPQWKNSTDVETTLNTYAWVCLSCDGHNQPHTPGCSWCGQPRINGSPITAFADLPPTPKDEPAAAPSPFPGYQPE